MFVFFFKRSIAFAHQHFKGSCELISRLTIPTHMGNVRLRRYRFNVYDPDHAMSNQVSGSGKTATVDRAPSVEAATQQSKHGPTEECELHSICPRRSSIRRATRTSRCRARLPGLHSLAWSSTAFCASFTTPVTGTTEAGSSPRTPPSSSAAGPSNRSREAANNDGVSTASW
jgi:hypothetical protein